MPPRTIKVKVGERWFNVQVDNLSSSPITALVDGTPYQVEIEGRTPTAVVPAPVPASLVTQPSAPPPASPPSLGAGSDKTIRSPMPGKVLAITVRPGESVSPDQEVCVVEAMKMEQSITAGVSGVIKTIHVQPMQQVSVDQPLLELE